MKKDIWRYLGPGAALIAILFIVASYIYNQKVHKVTREHGSPPAELPGLDVYGSARMASDEGKAFLRLWEMKTRRLVAARYDLEIILNDAEFFRALAMVKGKGSQKEEELYKAYLDRFQFDRKLVFTVIMHSSVGKLLGLQPEGWIVLRLDGGEELEHENWHEPEHFMDYHRRAVVTFAREDGKPIFAPEIKTVELVLRDPNRKTEEVLRWDLGN